MPNEDWTTSYDEQPRALGAGNRMPAGARIDPYNLGLAGMRLLADRALAAINGFGRENLDAAGIKLEALRQYRAEMTAVLSAMVRHNGRNPSRRQARAAAMRLIGHFRMGDALPLLTQVLAAPHELPTQRAAAADALGFMGVQQVEPDLLKQLADPHPAVQRAAAAALGQVGGPVALAELQRLRVGTASPAVQKAAHEAIRRIEQRQGKQPSLPPWQPQPRTDRGVTKEVKIQLPTAKEIGD